MLSFLYLCKSGDREQYLRVENVTVGFFHLQLVWSFTTRNYKQHIGSACDLQVIRLVFTAQHRLLVFITTNHHAAGRREKKTHDLPFGVELAKGSVQSLLPLLTFAKLHAGSVS